MLRATASACAAFSLFLTVHVLQFHFLAPYEKVNSVLGVAVIGLAVFLLLLRMLPSERWFRDRLHISDVMMKRAIYPLFGALFYGFLILGYFEFYFTVDRSITFRMLIITDEQPDRSITPERMLKLYNAPTIVTRRFDDLAYGGYLDQQGNTYRLTIKGRLVVTIYRFAIDFLRLGKF